MECLISLQQSLPFSVILLKVQTDTSRESPEIFDQRKEGKSNSFYYSNRRKQRMIDRKELYL